MRGLPWTIGWTIVLSVVVVERLAAQSESAPQQPQAIEVDPLLLKPPKTLEDVEARVQLARKRLEALRPTTQAATQPATQPADQATAQQASAPNTLYLAWENYLAELLRGADVIKACGATSGEQHIAEVGRRIQERQMRTAELAALPEPTAVPEPQWNELSELSEDTNAEVQALSEKQTQRAARLASGFRQQREELGQQLAQFRAASAEEPAAAATATAPASATLPEARRELRQVQIALVELKLWVLAKEEEHTRLVHKQDERYLEALNAYAAALRERFTALSEVRRRSALEDIEQERQRATERYELALLDLKSFCHGALADYFKNRQLLNNLRARFDKSALDRLKDRVTLSAAVWVETVDSMEYRSGKEMIILRREVSLEHRRSRDELRQLRTMLGESIAKVHEVRTARDRVQDRFQTLTARLIKVSESADAEVRTRLLTESTALRSELDEATGATVKEAQQLVARLREAETLVADHMAALDDVQDQLYWAMLLRRESGLSNLDFKSIAQEFRQLLGRPLARETAPGKGEPSLAGLGLTDAGPDVRVTLTAWLRGVRDDLSDVAGVDWVLGIGVLVVAGLIAVWLRRKAAASVETATQRLESEKAVGAADGAGRRFSTRVNVLLWRLVRDMAILLPFFLALWVVAWAAALPPYHAQPIAWFLGLIVIIVALIRLAHHAFDTAVPVHRVVPCSDTVARHCRRTCIAALVLGLLLLPVLALLFFLRTAPGIQSLLTEVFKAGFLLILLGFVSRRARLADLLGWSRADWKRILVSAMHPILFLMVLALLVMQVLGYGMLVGFVGRGLLASLAIIVIVSVIVEYLCDLVGKLAPGVSLELAPDAAQPLDAPNGQSAGSLGSSGGYLMRLLKTLLRLAGSVAALILILHVWVGDSYWAWFDWKICAILAIVVVAALLVDRVLFTALKAVVASGRLPESTSSIIRRWVRGLLSAVVLLIIVTVAGYRIEHLWAPLSAMLAMVAVGFVAVWSLLSNILATLMILIWRPFNVGEHVDIQPEGISGEVIDINFMYTLLKTEDGGRITVPNSQFVQKFVKRTKAVGSPVRSLAQQLESEKPVGE